MSRFAVGSDNSIETFFFPSKQMLSRTIGRLQEMAEKLNIEVENVPEL